MLFAVGSGKARKILKGRNNQFASFCNISHLVKYGVNPTVLIFYYRVESIPLYEPPKKERKNNEEHRD
jgi:hypothetical protein